MNPGIRIIPLANANGLLVGRMSVVGVRATSCVLLYTGRTASLPLPRDDSWVAA